MILKDIIELMSIKLHNEQTDAEQEALSERRRLLRNRVITYFKLGEWCCYNVECELEFDNIDKLLSHLNRCCAINIDMNEITDFIEPFRRYIPSTTACKMCGKEFKNKNLLNQHINRGVRYGCVERALKTKLQCLSVNAKVEVMEFIKKLEGETC